MNYDRPLSNLGALLKILEKVLPHLLNLHINSSNTSNHCQSTNWIFRSIGTGLLKIHIDILSSMDDDRVTALALLDLSAAFDTIGHTISLNRLDEWFGFTWKALDWF